MTTLAVLLLLAALVCGIAGAHAGMREAEETSRREHLAALRWRP